MTSGYYDYDAYVEELLAHLGERRNVLELGVGTGLVCEKLLAASPGDLRLTGIDHTESMLAQARARLGGRVRLLRQDILNMDAPAGFDVAFSVGGVWLCVRDQDGIGLSSHLVEDEDNISALENLAAVLQPGGSLLLAVQAAHRPYRRPLPGDLMYAQDLHDEGNGRFTKDYFVLREDTVVAHQRSRYRVFPMEQADRMLHRCGFRLTSDGGADGLFRHYLRR
ncbi:class I SAM-dependent methyltransferase [Streptomyces sp. NPDC047117]|uniref:class I SAM-dependent methyltransferase n=1 Tax=Streptomyces sp. NPDC047117 TaxID=3155379 RepID=UPI00340FD489